MALLKYIRIAMAGGESMKIAFDVDVLAKQMPIREMVAKVADWGYRRAGDLPGFRRNKRFRLVVYDLHFSRNPRKVLG
ncbi:MAG: hypothetical protein LBJ59_00585 [Zoogloeaceae bacterium]|nr:hypothetical protein [Zoogloeaceae bacterium]